MKFTGYVHDYSLAFHEDARQQGPLLASLIYFNDCKTIIEIGVAHASTTAYLCQAAASTNGHVYGYDLWGKHGLKGDCITYASKFSCEKYLNKFGYKNYTLTKTDTTSQEFRTMINERHPKIDFAFIDGCHSYQGVKNDFDVVYPNLSDTGIIAFHDTVRIDGTREFMLDLRTKYFDGTYDIVEFPFGNFQRRVGITLLVKRSIAKLQDELPMDEQCNLENRFDQIYAKEREWYKKETNR
jgi:predicted O-methyltransferase YrrM